MLTYLAEGWFSPTEPQLFAAAVLDGALDSAGVLLRAGIDSATVDAMRGLLLQQGSRAFTDGDVSHNVADEGVARTQEHRNALCAYVNERTDDNPVWQGFMADGLESVSDLKSLLALCGHLGHISQTMELLQASRAARRGPELTSDILQTSSQSLDRNLRRAARS